MKHLKELSEKTLKTVKVGEQFTYCRPLGDGIAYHKGVKVSDSCMIPVGLYTASIETARLQN